MQLTDFKPKNVFRRAREHREHIEIDKKATTTEGLSWRRGTPCDSPLYDAGSAQIGTHLYVFGGYVHLGEVSQKVRVFDMENEKWLGRFDAPLGLPTSHCAITSDGQRYIYCVSGQVGAECSPAVRSGFVLDTETRTWTTLPPLPEARYAGTMQLWRGRLHFLGGALENRWTPSAVHWSLGVYNGNATEETWTTMQSIPMPGMHRGSLLYGDAIYLIGGQQGDFVAIEGDPNCKCNGHTQETYLAECYRLLSPSGAWERLADMPIPSSHTDFSIFHNNREILVFGGQIYKDPTDFYMRLTDAVQVYDVADNSWRIGGHLPYRLKFPVAGKLHNKVILIGGQRGKRSGDTPGAISNQVLITDVSNLPSKRTRSKPSHLRGRSILMVSDRLSFSGAPLLCLETAQSLIEAGVCVRFASLADDTAGWTAATKLRVPVVPLETAIGFAKDADIVVANTVSKPVMDWVSKAVDADPTISQRLVHWVHEIDVEHFLPGGNALKEAALSIFDSNACRDAWREAVGQLKNPVVVNPGLSPSIASKIEQLSLPFPADPSSQAPPVHMTREEIRASLGLTDKDFLILCLATVEERKGQRLLLRTVTELAKKEKLPLKVLLVGFRNWRQRLKFLLKLKPSEYRVLTAGRAFVWQSEIASFYRAADAFVTNTQGISETRGECFGRVTIEAMSMGLPTFGTAAGGTLDILDDGETGGLFPVGIDGQEALKCKLKKTATDPSYAKRLSTEGKARVLKEFSEDRFLNDFETALLKMIR